MDFRIIMPLVYIPYLLLTSLVNLKKLLNFSASFLPQIMLLHATFMSIKWDMRSRSKTFRSPEHWEFSDLSQSTSSPTYIIQMKTTLNWTRRRNESSYFLGISPFINNVIFKSLIASIQFIKYTYPFLFTFILLMLQRYV